MEPIHSLNMCVMNRIQYIVERDSWQGPLYHLSQSWTYVLYLLQTVFVSSPEPEYMHFHPTKVTERKRCVTYDRKLRCPFIMSVRVKFTFSLWLTL